MSVDGSNEDGQQNERMTSIILDHWNDIKG